MNNIIKQENAIIDINYYPKVFDFGLSRNFINSTYNSKQIKMAGIVGTPLYIASKILDSDDYGSAIEVYVFTYLAYEISTIVARKDPYVLMFRKIRNRERP